MGVPPPVERRRIGPRSAQRLELEDHNELYAYLVDARLVLGYKKIIYKWNLTPKDSRDFWWSITTSKKKE